jgi:photosystem II stability/assembly factor-like uncharacterized protein
VAGTAPWGELPLINAASRSGSGFAAKLDPSGSRLLYSTYLAGRPRAIAVDTSGAAYITGTAERQGFQSVRPIHPCHDGSVDAFIVKLTPAGSSYDYATCLGGSRDDEPTGIAVDAGGSAYVVGTTLSLDFPTARPLDATARTGPLWKTDDGGRSWANLPLDSYSVNQLVASTATAGTWYAGTLYGAFTSTDQGTRWRRLGLPPRDSLYQPTVYGVAFDPHAASTLYASTSVGLVKSSDGGEQWTTIGTDLPFQGAYLRGIAVAPDSRAIYAASQRGFWKSVDAGAKWTANSRGLGAEPYVRLLSVDPASGTLYADIFRNDAPVTVDRVFRSTDAGASWVPTPLEIRQRLVTALVTVPSHGRGLRRPREHGLDRPTDDVEAETVVYLAARPFFSGDAGVLFRSDDSGDTWTAIGRGLPSAGPDVLAVAPSDHRIVYAAARGVVFVSSDRGDTFEQLRGMSAFESVSSLAVDPVRAMTVFVGASVHTDAFVAKIHPSGGSLEYSTYLGGFGEDRATGIVVDELGRAIVVGSTDSDDFPAVAPLQARRDVDAFVSVLDGGGSVLLFSTWLGGTGRDSVVSAARSSGGVLISGGSAELSSMFPGAAVSGPGAFVGRLDLSGGAGR